MDNYYKNCLKNEDGSVKHGQAKSVDNRTRRSCATTDAYGWIRMPILRGSNYER